MGESVLRKFGRYFLLDRIAQGGMAEIFRARLATRDGAGRILVVKRIQGAFGENSEFVQMFQSEIKVTMGFSHPNIVQLYDFGEEEGQPYIAMELVDGCNIRQFVSRYLDQKEFFPVEFAVSMVADAAAGLGYAHAFKDRVTGQSLHIVHRDISPQNILVSFDGNVKVIDFGIAKATTNSESTRTGIIKGKPSYLSPEQISGEELDGRCDIFALGIVLWECLAGRKLFSAPGENEFAVLKQIENCTAHVKPPSTFNPAVPKELDYIVLRALAKQRDKRFQDGEEFHRALKKFLVVQYPDFGTSDLAQAMKQRFKNEIAEDRKMIQQLSFKAEELLEKKTPASSAPATVPASPSSQLSGKRSPSPESMLEVNEDTTWVRSMSGELVASAASIPIPSAQKTGLFRAPPPPASTNPYATRSISRPPPSVEVPPKSNSFVGRAVVAIVLATLGSGGAAWFGVPVPVLSSIVAQWKQQVPAGTVIATSTITADMTSSSTAEVEFRVSWAPAVTGVELWVDGAMIGSDLKSWKAPSQKPLQLTLKRTGFHDVSTEFIPQSGKVVALRLQPQTPGYLTVVSVPSAEAYLTPIEGSAGRQLASSKMAAWSLGTDVENTALPVGRYQLQLLNSVLGLGKTVEVVIEEGKATRINETLTPTASE